MIKYKRTIYDIQEHQAGVLPVNAEKMEAPDTTEEMMKKAVPIAVILCVVMFLSMFIKTRFAGEMVVFRPTIFVAASAEHTVLNGVMFGMACVGMISPNPDVYNVILVMRQSKGSDRIMFYGDDIYKIC